MAHEKLFTPKQAAQAVLDKVTEVLKKSELSKSYEGFKAVEESARESGASDPAAVAAAAGRKKYGKHAFQEAAAHGKKMHKCDTCGQMHKSEEDVTLCKNLTDVIDGLEVMSKSEMDKHGLSPEEIKAKLDKHGLSPGEIKAKMSKAEGYKPQNPKKENAVPSEHGSKEAFSEGQGKAPKGEIHPKEHVEGEPTNETQTQPDPQHNPKEQAEGNNELAGTTPTQVGNDLKAKPGYDEMKSHLKLAKFIGRMEHKRSTKNVV